MVVVKTVDTGNADVLHRQFLNHRNPFLPLFYAGSTATRSIQNATHLPLGNEGIEHLLIETPGALGGVVEDIEAVLVCQSDDFLIRHLQCLLYFRLRTTELHENFTNLIAVNLGIFCHHIAHNIEIEFEHLANLLFERHLLEMLLDFLFNFSVLGNGLRLCSRETQNTECESEKYFFHRCDIICGAKVQNKL